jgi:hypothetical protein
MAGKRLDDLKLSDAPLTSAKPLDPRSTAWYRFSKEIDDLLATGRYTWAEDTLTGIQETVERTEVVSEGQRRAVTNIEARGDEQQRRGSRRYEGFGGRRW